MRLLILGGILFLLSCTKNGYRPDHDQVTCKDVSYWKQLFQDSLGKQPLTDSTIIDDSQRCIHEGDNSSIDAIELAKAENYGIKWERLCDIDGTPYYLKIWSIIK